MLILLSIGAGAQITGISTPQSLPQTLNPQQEVPAGLPVTDLNDLSTAPGQSKTGITTPLATLKLITGFWDLSGNSGIDPNVNFIGTTDAQPLRFRVNNAWAGHIGAGDYNLFLGKGAGQNATGTGNTLLGASAGQNVTGSIGNVFIGMQSGFSEISSSGFNTFTGYASGYSNTTGYYNTISGGYAGFKNDGGIRNMYMGYSSGYSNTTGNDNTFAGESSGYYNATGSGNVFIGRKAGYSNTTAGNNTLIGSNAGETGTTAAELTAVGAGSLKNNTGNFNTAFGYLSLTLNTTGLNNTVAGNRVMAFNTNGSYNTGMGVNTLGSNTSGTFNTAFGTYALYGNYTGNSNTGVGYLANTTLPALFNATAIGANSMVNASNKVSVGSPNVMVIGGQVGWSTFSDGRFKENVQDNVPGLDFITQLRPVTYTLNIDKYGRHLMQDKTKEEQQKYSALISASAGKSDAAGVVHTGFIAQDVEDIINKLGYKFDGLNVPQNPTDNYSINYSQFIMPLVKAVQEQQKQINELREIIKLQQQQQQIITRNSNTTNNQ